MQTDDRIARRRALQLLGAAGGGLLIARYGGNAAAGALPAAASTMPGAAGLTCAETPEGEIGPFFADDSAAGFNRSNIVSNLDGTQTQHGVPLALSLHVRDARKGCAAVAGAQVDIWHCSAGGVYSDEGMENTTGLTWLRGYQHTDAAGVVRFTTIVPGWYDGRTTHVHLRIRSAYSEASSPNDGTNTTQLFFPQSLVDGLSRNVAPYNTQGPNPTRNASDHVYTEQTKGTTLLTLTGSTHAGYAATYTIDLPIAAS